MTDLTKTLRRIRDALKLGWEVGLERLTVEGDVETWQAVADAVETSDGSLRANLGSPFMTCESGDGRYEVRLRYPTLKQAQDAHTALLAVTGDVK